MAQTRTIPGRLAPLVGLVVVTAAFALHAEADPTVPQCVTGAPWLGLSWQASCDPQVGDGPLPGDAPAAADGATPLSPGWWNGDFADGSDEDAFRLVPYKATGSGGIGGGCAANPCYRVLVRSHADVCLTADLWIDDALSSTGTVCDGQDIQRVVIGNHKTELVLSNNAAPNGAPLTYYVVYE